MEIFVKNLCIKIKMLSYKIKLNEEADEAIKQLRAYNIILIDLSKAFPNEAFRGVKHVIGSLYYAYKLMNDDPNLNVQFIIQTHSIVPLLGVLETVQVNEELFPVRKFS